MDELDQELGPNLFEDALKKFIDPEIARRQAAGELPDGTVVHRFQVLLPMDAAPEVRLNEEVGGTAKAIAARKLEAGQEVTTDDISGIESYRPQPQDSDIPHITGFSHRGGWTMAFEFAHRHPDRFGYLDRGKEFAVVAQTSFQAGSVHAGLDCAFSAAELLVKAELLSYGPTIEQVIDSKTHQTIRTAYNLWGRLGNTDRKFVELFNRLADLRAKARYVVRDPDFKPSEPEILFEHLAELVDHVTLIAEADMSDPAVPRSYQVVATRDLRVGQILMSSDLSIHPPKNSGD